MKFNSAIFSVAALCGYAHAQEGPTGRGIRQQSDMFQTLYFEKFPGRNDGINYLVKYGCYCHQPGLRMVGSRYNYHGPALDDLDNLCRDAYRAQNCLQQEFGMEFTTEENQPNSRWYPWYLDETTNEIVCNNKNFPNWENRDDVQFKRKNCLIEKEFVEKVIALIESGYKQEDDYIKMNNWRYQNRYCKTAATPFPANNNACCGSGLNTKPYNNEFKDCCDGKIVDKGTCLT